MNKHVLPISSIILSLFVSGCGPTRALALLPTTTPTSTPTVAPLEATPTPTEAPGTLPTPSIVTAPVIFDDDGSPDGTTALLYLLSHPGVSLQAVSISYGEAHPQVYIQHIGRILDAFGVNGIPLGAGQDAPLAGSSEFPEWLRQSADGFWGLPLPNAERSYPVQSAAELMVSVINQNPEPVAIFVSGPCTNLAQALRLDPGIRENVAAVYIMGGAVYAPGNVQELLPDPDNTVAEWNIYADPLAAKEVFESGLNLYLVPLDATSQVMISAEDTSQWRMGGAIADMAADMYDMLLGSWGVEYAAIWDLMTAAIMVQPDLCGFQQLHLDVITQGPNSSGQTVLVPNEEPNTTVCLEPDAGAIRQTLADVFGHSP